MIISILINVLFRFFNNIYKPFSLFIFTPISSLDNSYQIYVFQVVVTCGLDSYIISWNPWDGKRLLVIKDAHTVMIHGELKPVEITAATFDPGQQRLLTGAHDGTLKVSQDDCY